MANVNPALVNKSALLLEGPRNCKSSARAGAAESNVANGERAQAAEDGVDGHGHGDSSEAGTLRLQSTGGARRRGRARRNAGADGVSDPSAELLRCTGHTRGVVRSGLNTAGDIATTTGLPSVT